MTARLEARDVHKRFHAGTAGEVRAVDGVSLAVAAGACVLVGGPSGSGKTTLLALLGTLERPTAGSVAVDGIDPAGLGEAARSRLRRRFGFAFAASPLLPRLPVWENVTLGLVPRGAGPRARRSRAAALLERVALVDRIDAPADELSAGEVRRAGLVRALAAEPEILVADEPLANLDPAAAERVVALLREFHAAGGTLLVATHAAAGFPFADRAVRLDRGRLAADA